MSNRLTFSLASLILIFAIAFAPTVVMAHGPGVTPAAVPEDHTHPVNTAIENDPLTAGITEDVPTHNSHPSVTSITLKAGDAVRGNMVAVSGTTVGTTDVFTLVITFDQPVVAANNLRAVPAAADETTSPLEGNNSYTQAVLNVDGTTATGTVSIADATRVANTENQFEAVATLATAFPSGTADANDKEFTFRVRVNVNAVFSLATFPEFTEVPGGNSLLSDVYTFTLVNALPEIVVEPTAPVAPASLTVMAGNAQATLTWAVVEGADSYEYSKDGGTFWAPIPAADITMNDDGTMSSYTVMDLMNGTEYMFHVRAVNSVGDGAASAVATATPMVPVDAPGPVTGLTATAGDGQVMLSWTGPTTGGAVDSYEYSMNGGVSWMPITDSDAETTEHTVMDLTNGQDYSFIVRAVNSAGNSASNEISSTPMMTPAPAAPASISATAGDGQVTLTWAVVEGADSYEYSKDGGTAWAAIPAADITMNDDGTMASYIVMGLTNGTEVSLTVRAVGAGGDGTASAAAKATPMMAAGAPMTSYDEATKTTTLAGMIAAHGFFVIDSDDLPDLEQFLFVGGTIGLGDNLAAAGGNSRTVVISEILWGLDLGAAVAQETMHQFIELYNTTNAAIDLTGWTLTFTEGRSVPASDIDQVSNRAGAGWVADIGQSGRVTGTTAVNLDNTITPVRIVSMYRNINYNKVETEAAKATVNRGELLKGVPGGNAKGSWKASTRHTTNRWIYDSKGRKHATSTPIVSASSVARSPFVINEIGNGSGDSQDWVELRNVTADEKSLKNYHLSIVTATGTDNSLVNLHDKDYKVPGNGFILLVNTDPSNTDLAGGVNVALAAADQENKGASHLYHVNSNLKLPDNGKFNLILRNAHDKLKASSHFIDAVGMQNYSDQGRGTSFWPLSAAGGKHGDVNNDDDGDGHEDFRSGFVYERTKAGASNVEHTVKVRGFTGIGYDRTVVNSKANGGTPGYDNGSLKDKLAGLSDKDSITISEIMVDTGEGRQNLAQWIELYNSSMTEAVNLNGWKLHIENAASENGELETNTFSATITLGTMTISPNQTVLIATSTGLTSDRDHFPSSRVVNLWTTKAHRDALEMARRTDPVLSSTGFNIMLADKDNKTVDEAGNLDGNRRSRDEPAWVLPTGEDDGRRSSLVRVYDEGVALTGTMADAWVSADATNLAWAISHTYYGNPDDFGTPGFRAGGPLPVSLSKFRPERQADGSIVVRWITESELDNAGFNILRSETRDGEFTKLNAQLIEGQGTTSERNTYDFVDTTAKPNVVYYYQIQDVSLDGKVQTLRQSRLKGHVSPAGKLTTVWGELKALQ